jgi:glutathione S-transferase
MKKEKGKASNAKTTFGKRRDGKHKKTSGPKDKAEIASLNWRMEFDGLMPVAEALRNGSPAMADRALPGPVNYAQIPELAQRGLVRAQRFFEDLNAHLAGRSFVAAEQFSVADITAVVAVDFARVIKLKPDERYPYLLRWRAAMGERPSFKL